MTQVKPRFDGQGDPWADSHREGLGRGFNMNDVDGFIGLIGFAANTGDRLFIEYVPDDYANRGQAIRTYSTVALFDRKASLACAMGEGNSVSLACYLDLCRRLAVTQARPPKFFFVVGRDAPPWDIVQIDIETGMKLSTQTLSGMNWQEVWRAAGLTELRDTLRREHIRPARAINAPVPRTAPVPPTPVPRTAPVPPAPLPRTAPVPPAPLPRTAPVPPAPVSKAMFTHTEVEGVFRGSSNQ